jgi:hypothetical protein
MIEKNETNILNEGINFIEIHTPTSQDNFKAS